MNDFLSKYYPTKLSSIIGNNNNIRNIKAWLKEFNVNRNESCCIKKKKKTKSCLLITGDHGIGKTCTVMTLLEEGSYTIKKIDITLTKDVRNDFYKILNKDNILDQIMKKNKQQVIVFDNIEMITSKIDRNFVLSVIKFNEKKWMCPIIFISHNEHSRYLSLLRQNTNVINFYQPYHEQMMELLIRICKGENIKMSNEEVANRIIVMAQKDYRKLIQITQDIITNIRKEGKTKITQVELDDYFKTTKEKDVPNNIFLMTEMLLTKFRKVDECLRMYMSEKVIMPLMIHQNYINFLMLRETGTTSEMIESLKQIAFSITKGDIIESYIFGDQNWDMISIHGFYSCVFPTYFIHDFKKGKIDNGSIKTIHLDFPLDLNRTSSRKINKKNIVNSMNVLKTFQLDDFLHLSNLIREIINQYNPDDASKICQEILNEYNIRLDDLLSILKINKIDKFSIPTNVKKNLE
jgi:DNA polymerase III delta prime subunit